MFPVPREYLTINIIIWKFGTYFSLGTALPEMDSRCDYLVFLGFWFQYWEREVRYRRMKQLNVISTHSSKG